MGQPVNTSAVVDLTGLVINFIGGYTVVQTERLNFDVIFGARYLGLDTDLNFTVGNQSIPFSGSGSNWDGIIGARWVINLNKKWFVPLYADVGAGDSDSTWQVLGGIGYRFNKVEAIFAYRHQEYNFDSDGLLDNMIIKGPTAGVTFRF